jgi:hypothetical protein
VVGWLLPFDSGPAGLFPQAEVQFLFPAPVSRRSLLVHRMMRSQIGILLGSIIPALMVQSFSGYARLRISIATWLILSTAKIYATGVSLARTRLTSSDTRARRVALAAADCPRFSVRDCRDRRAANLPRRASRRPTGRDRPDR